MDLTPKSYFSSYPGGTNLILEEVVEVVHTLQQVLKVGHQALQDHVEILARVDLKF